MIYNIDFLIASLIFMLVILFHFMQQHGFYIQDNRTFLWLVVLGITNILMNVICAVLISWGGPAYRTVTEHCVIILYSLQILVPNAVINHVFRQFPKNVGNRTVRGFISFVLPGIMLVMIFANRWTHDFFEICEDGSYRRMPCYDLMYVFGASYLLMAAMSCVIYRKHISRFKRYAIWEGILISGITVAFQSVYRDVLLIGFGITLGITVLFFTLNNPFYYTDSLTAAFDVRYFRDRVNSYIDHRRSFHVLLVELTQLKQINNVTGASVGNSLLRATAQMLRETNKQNLVFRVTGKRFALITDSQVLYEEARTRVLQFFHDPILIGDRPVQIPITLCGILDAQKLGSSDSLLSYSEYLLSLAAKSHRGPYLIQNSADTLKGFQYNQLVAQYLNTAVQQDLFELNYQPVYSTVQKKFTNMEALSRLTHPTLGPVSPEVFIRLAEKNDLIPRIGLLQLQKICRFVKENPVIMENMDSVKVNLSPVELMRPGHVDLLIGIIRDAGLPTRFFQFEITETVATEYSSSLTHVSDKFTQAGIRLCLDDFGSGYANLNTVFRLPFSTIKLDRSLLQDICHNPKAASLYQGLAASIHAMDAHIIAEGVETAQELDRVTACGINQIQGYYFSRPLTPEQLLELLKKQSQEASV